MVKKILFLFLISIFSFAKEVDIYETNSKDDICDYFEEYTYLFENGKWYIRDYETDEYIELTLDICID